VKNIECTQLFNSTSEHRDKETFIATRVTSLQYFLMKSTEQDSAAFIIF